MIETVFRFIASNNTLMFFQDGKKAFLELTAAVKNG